MKEELPPTEATRGTPTRQRASAWILCGLAGAMLTAWGIRSLIAPNVFIGDGVVLLGIDDSAYHARRALYNFVNFPAILQFDPYMAYPDGSAIPFPPLYDWLLAGVARLFGRSELVFETVVAWASVFFATATLLPIYSLGRTLLGPRTGLVAAWIFAVLPASSLLSSVGYLDHHAAVSLLGALWLWSSIREIDGAPGHIVGWTALHGAIVASLILVWSGSLLYIGLGEGARLLIGGICWSRRDRLLAQSRSALLAAVLVIPWVAMAPEPIDGPYASTALSWLQVLVLLGLAALAGTMAWLERRKPEPRMHRRALRAVTAGILISLPLMAVPGLFDAVAGGAAFVSGNDVWAPSNPEQQPLFSSIPQSLKKSATARFGGFAYLVPVLPLLVAFGFLRRERRESTALLFIWTTALTLLALKQVRFAHDLAPLASVVFAGFLVVLHRQVIRFLPPPVAFLSSTLLTGALLWPAFAGVHYERMQVAKQALELRDQVVMRGIGAPGTEIRFAKMVREATPATSGFFDNRVAPEYGLLVHPNFGHSFLYFARRPVPANNFGPYLDRKKFDDTLLFYKEADGKLAIEALERLAPRYVVTTATSFIPPMPYAQQLHRGDGFRDTDPVCGPCLRLITEGPRYGRPSWFMIPGPVRNRVIAYKLFERVAGAVIEVVGSPGTPVSIELGLDTPIGRRLVFTLNAETDESGRARLRVPYATDITPPVHAPGPYQILVGDTWHSLDVSDKAVRSGSTVLLATTRETSTTKVDN